MAKLKNYVLGEWTEGSGKGRPLTDAVTGEEIVTATTEGLDFKEILNYARNTGNPALRKMTFHERGRMLKALALHLNKIKKKFYEISYRTGATKADSWIDIDGGIGNLFIYASKGRRELPDEPFHVDGNPEILNPDGKFLGHHICVPLEGTAVHINAFNFPVWGMLEKIAVNLLAGMPAIVKPASITSYLTEAVFREIIDSKILPKGSLQLLCGSAGDILDHVGSQDVVTFTGSAETGKMLKSKENILENSVRFNMEADSLNCSILGPDATPDSDEFKLFVKEVAREMTVKAGQKCTAIRRTIIPENLTEPVIDALKTRLEKTTLGNPRNEDVRMGPLASKDQVTDVSGKIKELLNSCEVAYGSNFDDFVVVDADRKKGAFMPSTLLYCSDPFNNTEPHEVEAFGPVSTVMAYKSNEEAALLAKMGKGSLVGSVFTGDDNFAKEMALGTATQHGRLYFMNGKSAKSGTGHGSPLPHLVHGGPGRAGGGEEMGGIRGVYHYMQRTAIQGHPTTIMKITNQYVPGAEKTQDVAHPFTKTFEEINIGDSITTHKRTITEGDIVNFANLSWDHFYAHTDVTSLDNTIFEERVAHGYFIMSAAAGLFVHPGKGPVVANYGLDELRFTEPVYAGTTIYVKLTCKQKTWKELKEDDKVPTGEVKWQVEVFNNEDDELVALGTILTLVKREKKKNEKIW